MTPRAFPFAIVVLCAFAIAIVTACGGGGDNSSNRPGNLTDPRTVPTATAWQDPPKVIMLDPDHITPIGGGATPVPQDTGGGDGGQPGVCGATYTVEQGDTMFGIADKCGVDAQDLIDANPNADPSALGIGEELVIP